MSEPLDVNDPEALADEAESCLPKIRRAVIARAFRDIADRDATIAALTERAEGAERERDRAEKAFGALHDAATDEQARAESARAELEREVARMRSAMRSAISARLRRSNSIESLREALYTIDVAYTNAPRFAKALDDALAELLPAITAKPTPKAGEQP